ncbi:hypothetical protein [Thalassotalea mangrovi]|uniref:Succinylglutamate desuccinylase n=1 Tax=Thalassotalea mangrovi TaxID=2572245 RepID=A0A4U1BBQ2_9GAMM|nr:hypothetical protein [Thalassotalea mangrovi]TKB47449.1 hypothetical protein E8M12_01280 [Thalassotalea mangrovi]
MNDIKHTATAFQILHGFKLYQARQLSAGINLDDFIAQFDGEPFVVRFAADKSAASGKPQIFTTLLHGNETSGVEALRRLLDTQPTPYCDTYILVASVRVATTPPKFYHRMLPNEADLNRCFKISNLQTWAANYALAQSNASIDGQSGGSTKLMLPELLAFKIFYFVNTLKPRWLLDLHNTSGASPAFAVTRHLTHNHTLLCQQFSPFIVRSQLNVGALFELEFDFPCVTIECGGTGDELANQTAYTGIHRLMHTPLSELRIDSEPAVILDQPIRLEVRKDKAVRLGYSNSKQPKDDITLMANIDAYNFADWHPGQLLGWASEEGFNSLTATDEHGQERIDELFHLQHGEIRCSTKLHLFMITNRTDIALSDCLLYAVILPQA